MKDSINSRLNSAAGNSSGNFRICTGAMISNFELIRLINIPKIVDSRGSLIVVEELKHINFSIKRVYCLLGVSQGATRAGHAHKELHQLIVPLSGSFDISLTDGFQKLYLSLSDPSVALYLPPMIWRDMSNFTLDSVCMVLASDYYDELDYYRDFDEFLHAQK